MRLAVGGNAGDDDGNSSEEALEQEGCAPFCFNATGERAFPTTRKDENWEPFTYGSLPVKMFQPIIDFLNIEHILDVSVGDGNLALASIIEKKSYTGCAFTETRATLVRTRCR